MRFLIVLLAGLALTAATAAQGDFPTCQFPYFGCESVVENPPFTIDPIKWTNTTLPDGSSRYCFTLIKTHFTQPTVPARCGPTDKDGSRLKKISVTTSPYCQNAMRDITFGNETLARSTQRFSQCGTLTTKITYGSKPLGTYADLPDRTPFCFTLPPGSCHDLIGFAGQANLEFALVSEDNKCCPIVPIQVNVHPSPRPSPRPSPSPSPPVNFPYCTCRNYGANPYQLTNASVTSTAKGNQYCWDVQAIAVPDRKCGSFDLRKIELDMVPSCQGAVAELSFNGQALAPSYQRSDQQPDGTYKHEVLKVVRANSSTSPLGTFAYLSTHTAQLCMTLRPGTCGTLASFCPGGRCANAFFGPQDSCCSRGLPVM